MTFLTAPANDQDRAQIAEMAALVQEAIGETVEIADADQGYTGQAPRQAAAKHGIQLAVVKLPQAKRGFDLLPDDGWSNGTSAG